jgi:hypothetical protein
MALSKTSRFYKKIGKGINRFGVRMRKKKQFTSFIRRLKNRNYTCYELRWTSMFSLYNLWLKLVTSFSASY